MLEGRRPCAPPILFEALSERYGWTPDQIRAMREDDIADYLTIIEGKESLAKAHAMKNQ